MIEYHICFGDGPSELEIEVREKIAQGWVPTGGLTAIVLADWESPSFYQAMTRDHNQVAPDNSSL